MKRDKGDLLMEICGHFVTSDFGIMEAFIHLRTKSSPVLISVHVCVSEVAKIEEKIIKN